MEKTSKSKKRKIRIIVIATVALLFILVYKFYNYVDNYYRATDNAMSYINDPGAGVSVEYIDNTIVFEPADEPVAGFIFYPGALVETEAYAPVLEQLAERGVLSVAVEMPYYLAMFDANGARGIQAKYPDIHNWYIGGHSLGGAMASLYIDRHSGEYEGFILMAAYSTEDLSQTDVDVLLLRGSEDHVLNMEKYNKYLANLPEDYKEVVIEGGCHAYFGDYGMQAGDGEPKITVEEQTEITVGEIYNFIMGEINEKI